MLKWVIFLSVALLLFAGHVVAEKQDRDREEKWSTGKKMVEGGGALLTGIAGIATLPFLFGFSAAGVVMESVAAGRHTSCLDRRQSPASYLAYS